MRWQEVDTEKFGAFDGWIGYTLPLTSSSGTHDTVDQARVMTRAAGDTSPKPREDLKPFPQCLKECRSGWCEATYIESM